MVCKKSQRPPLLHSVGRQVGKQVEEEHAGRHALQVGSQEERCRSTQADRKGYIGVRKEGKQTSTKESRMKGRKESM